MAKYSEKEVKAFEQKDLRISKLAVIKSLIEKAPLEDVYEVNKLCKIADKYLDYVNNSENPTNTSSVAGDKDGNDCSEAGQHGQPCWAEIAEELNLAIPNEESVKILNLLINEYKQTKKASANPSTILTHIIRSFGRYPTKMESVGVILNSLNNKE